MDDRERTKELVGLAPGDIGGLLPWLDITRAAHHEVEHGTDYQSWDDMEPAERQFHVAFIREVCSQLQTLRVIADHGPFCAQSVVLLKAVEDMEDLNDKAGPY